ncbi:MAG: GNAT family N-acetyltransferase [Betaproteobacteria bacterium HGW-Betaproteobacteria-16]|nr:MAG: GNAT family N-acetyltransferase [Betaproteobacteria bacterium HGW-Betaproteobacteria-16]
MTHTENFRPVPWDTAALGIDAYEIEEPKPEELDIAANLPGHYTVRVDPLTPKMLLHKYGFYYCDTLLEPYTDIDHFVAFDDAAVVVCDNATIDSLLSICHGAFKHDRFHRDFNVPAHQADLRYDNWLSQMHSAGEVRGLLYRDKLAGFIATQGSSLVLHALAETVRGRGLSKCLWTPVCRALFESGQTEVTSSVSSTNLPVLNLYARLGFRFRNPVDIYHRITR